VKLQSVTTGAQGKVDLVPLGAIHAEQGDPTRSVGVIVRSRSLAKARCCRGATIRRQTHGRKATARRRYRTN
jgi:hypothetical protein